MKLFQSLIVIAGLIVSANAAYITGGDAATQADASAVLDIVFVMDVSVSMNDEAVAISNSMQNIVDDIDCPDCDVYIRARLLGIGGTFSGTLFDQSTNNYVYYQGGTSTVDHVEDNAPAVTDMVTWYDWDDNTTAEQDYYKAVVTIGDEGTQDGYPVYQNDWTAAHAANQLAVNNDVMVFSVIGSVWNSAGYIADEPNRDAVFTALAEGGTYTTTNGTPLTFSATGGEAYFTNNSATDMEVALEEILCTAASGGSSNVPEPASITMLITGLLCLVGLKKVRKS
jgi:uncharacterized protein YegL